MIPPIARVKRPKNLLTENLSYLDPALDLLVLVVLLTIA